MSRRRTPHQAREKRRNRRALERAVVRCVKQISWSDGAGSGRPLICIADTMELVGLKLALGRL